MSTAPSGPFKILFLCTGNSARRILAECLIQKLGRGRFEASSAGANPTGKVNPHALRVLKDAFQIDAADAETYRHFWQVAQLLYRRIDLCCNLPLKRLDRLRLEQATRDIARPENALMTD